MKRLVFKILSINLKFLLLFSFLITFFEVLRYKHNDVLLWQQLSSAVLILFPFLTFYVNRNVFEDKDMILRYLLIFLLTGALFIILWPLTFYFYILYFLMTGQGFPR